MYLTGNRADSQHIDGFKLLIFEEDDKIETVTEKFGYMQVLCFRVKNSNSRVDISYLIDEDDDRRDFMTEAACRMVSTAAKGSLSELLDARGVDANDELTESIFAIGLRSSVDEIYPECKQF